MSFNFLLPTWISLSPASLTCIDLCYCLLNFSITNIIDLKPQNFCEISCRRNLRSKSTVYNIMNKTNRLFSFSLVKWICFQVSVFVLAPRKLLKWKLNISLLKSYTSTTLRFEILIIETELFWTGCIEIIEFRLFQFNVKAFCRCFKNIVYYCFKWIYSYNSVLFLIWNVEKHSLKINSRLLFNIPSDGTTHPVIF